jgi:hypothetical protein
MPKSLASSYFKKAIFHTLRHQESRLVPGESTMRLQATTCFGEAVADIRILKGAKTIY